MDCPPFPGHLPQEGDEGRPGGVRKCPLPSPPEFRRRAVSWPAAGSSRSQRIWIAESCLRMRQRQHFCRLSVAVAMYALLREVASVRARSPAAKYRLAAVGDNGQSLPNRTWPGRAKASREGSAAHAAVAGPDAGSSCCDGGRGERGLDLITNRRVVRRRRRSGHPWRTPGRLRPARPAYVSPVAQLCCLASSSASARAITASAMAYSAWSRTSRAKSIA